MSQTAARRLARQLSASTGEIYIAVTVPAGCWGGTETGWDVQGPAVTNAEIAQLLHGNPWEERS
jgi:hypothetical protein